MDRDGAYPSSSLFVRILDVIRNQKIGRMIRFAFLEWCRGAGARAAPWRGELEEGVGDSASDYYFCFCLLRYCICLIWCVLVI
jgi:hypothetical protein